MSQRNSTQKENVKPMRLNNREHSYTSWILLLFIIAFVAFVRIRLLSTPLERDEGEYAYMGQLLLQGVPPYQEAFNMKLPGTSMMYAFFMLLFGETITAIHLGLLIVNAASIVLLFILTKKWMSSGAGIVAAASFAVLSLSRLMLGFAAHATHFVILFALGGLLMLNGALEYKNNRWFFLAGISFGFAFLMKQPGISFIVLGLSILLFDKINRNISQKDLFRFGSLLVGGFLSAFLAILTIIVLGGTFDRFWFWVVQYSFEYGTVVTLREGIMHLSNMLMSLWDAIPLFCLLTGTGFVVVLTGRFQKRTTAILLLFGLFSFLAVVPGWYFRQHYFILFVPACSVWIGSGFHYFQETYKHRSRWKYIPILICAIVFGENMYTQRAYYFALSPSDIVRRCYGVNFFTESITISNYLAEHTAPDDRLAILGSEPQIYFYAKRRSASSHIYMYGMMEQQPYARKMQEEFIADVERVKPKFIVCFWIPYSWLATANSDTHIIDWNKEYTDKYYRLVGVADLIGLKNVQYVWGKDAQQYLPESKYSILIYERIDNHR